MLCSWPRAYYLCIATVLTIRVQMLACRQKPLVRSDVAHPTAGCLAQETPVPTDTPFRTRELMPNFGVEVLDADVTRETPETMADIVSLFHRHGALLLRGQTMSPAQQVTFTNLFGPPADNPRKEYTVPDYPDVFVISNKVVNGRNIGDPDAGTGWHYDMCYDRYPGLCTILHALEVPPEGSDTLLSDLCAVYEAFPAERRQDLEDMVIHYSYISLQEMNPTCSPDFTRYSS